MSTLPTSDGDTVQKRVKSGTRIFDLDLDVFVLPPLHNRREDGPRPADSEVAIPPEDEVMRIVTADWKISPKTPLRLLEQHQEIIPAIEDLLSRDCLKLPLCWVHIDAHDDFWGHYSKSINSGNFMYEVVKRQWCSVIAWVYPDDHFDFPAYVLNTDAMEVRFEDYHVPVRFIKFSEFKPEKGPDYLFMCRSPAYAPPKADRLYERIAAFCSSEGTPGAR